MEDILKLSINGKQYEIQGKDLSFKTSLNTFIRQHVNLCGTKAMCHEGGCGACIVSVKSIHPVSKKKTSYAVNSCLVPLFSCYGWEITTIEGLGGTQTGNVNEIQKRLATFNGSQCGFCSPGMVMNMNSLLENNTNITMKDVETSFGGNICRCTGYRPILDAFKSFCVDTDPKLLPKVQDIEDLGKGNTCPNLVQPDSSPDNLTQKLYINNSDGVWYKVYTIAEIIRIFRSIQELPKIERTYSLMAGNTGKGVSPTNNPIHTYIDISSVEELRKCGVDTNIRFGGSVTLSDAIKYFTKESHREGFSYMNKLAEHMELIANVPVRNVATLAGNLMIKHQHHEFPSDVFLLLELVGATIDIIGTDEKIIAVNPVQFLTQNMEYKVIANIEFYPMKGNFAMETYKIMPRAQNAHAYVNAGFLLNFPNFPSRCVQKATTVYGGIHPNFVHAIDTEINLTNVDLETNFNLQSVLSVLNNEINPCYDTLSPSIKYRKNLAVALLYKFLLCVSRRAHPLHKSGGTKLTRDISRGLQSYSTSREQSPLYQPVTKVEALEQCCGEAKYINDFPPFQGELHAAFVLAAHPPANIVSINPSKALETSGVVAFYSAKDIPGKNNFTAVRFYWFYHEEEIFASKKVLYYGQPIGLIIAKSHDLANSAAKLVEVEYEDTSYVPVVSLKSAVHEGLLEQCQKLTEGKMKNRGDNKVYKELSGSMEMGGQYHFTMETQSCICVPTERGELDVYPSSQWLDGIHVTMAEALLIDQSKINLHVRQIGGGYGAKCTRPPLIAIACALASYKLKKPVRLIMSLEDNMEAIGKRYGCYNEYKVEVDNRGKIQYLYNRFYEDFGSSWNENTVKETSQYIGNCYDSTSWEYEGIGVVTDKASNTACRGPGTTEAIAMTENIMDHIAFETGLDPLDVRIENIEKGNTELLNLIQDFRQSIDFDNRKNTCNEFNKNNRWRKRGLALIPMKYPVNYYGNFPATVTICHGDGTVNICHGGIECGQGINTKVKQVCAHILNIPMESISIKMTSTTTSANSMITGASIASEACCFATKQACIILLERLAPIKSEMDNPTWQDLVERAHNENVNLSANHLFNKDKDAKPYIINSAAAAEIEVDILTGNININRVDILEDTGDSLNPNIDIGQVEGAFIMGIGYWLTEKLIYSADGRLLTNRTWNYKPPGAMDNPIDFRVNFRQNAPNLCGVLRSKATGEPALCMSYVVIMALRHALISARLDKVPPETGWFSLGAPTTPEDIFLSSSHDFVQYSIE